MVPPGQYLQAMEVHRFTIMDSWETFVLYFLPFSCSIAEGTPYSGIWEERTLVRYYLLFHSHPVKIDIATQLFNHRGNQCHADSRVGLYGLFLLRFQGQL